MQMIHNCIFLYISVYICVRFFLFTVSVWQRLTKTMLERISAVCGSHGNNSQVLHTKAILCWLRIELLLLCEM